MIYSQLPLRNQAFPTFGSPAPAFVRLRIRNKQSKTNLIKSNLPSLPICTPLTIKALRVCFWHFVQEQAILHINPSETPMASWHQPEHQVKQPASPKTSWETFSPFPIHAEGTVNTSRLWKKLICLHAPSLCPPKGGQAGWHCAA